MTLAPALRSVSTICAWKRRGTGGRIPRSCSVCGPTPMNTTSGRPAFSPRTSNRASTVASSGRRSTCVDEPASPTPAASTPTSTRSAVRTGQAYVAPLTLQMSHRRNTPAPRGFTVAAMSMTRQRIAIAAAVLLTAPASVAHARATDGTITRIAGTTAGYAGDGGPATQAKMSTPRDVAFLKDGSYVIADFDNNVVRRVFPDGHITTDAGTGDGGFCCDGGPATDANLNRPRGVTSMPDGGYLVADTFNDAIRRVFPDGHIETIAGENGHDLLRPSDTETMPDGAILIADTDHDRIAKLAPDGTLATGLGPGARAFAGDRCPAIAAQLSQPRDISVGDDGSIYVADTGNDRIRRIPADGTITTVGGRGAGLSGDGDPAAAAQMTTPFSVAALPHGGFIFTDTGNHRVRRVTPMGTIFTVAGTTGGDSGDNGLAKNAQLNAPSALTLAPGGGFAVADTANNQIRRVTDIGAVPGAVSGHSVYIEPATGAVTARPLGQSADIPLQEEDLIPVGSQIDATNGHLMLTEQAGGAQIPAEVFDAPFTVSQGPGGAAFANFRLASLTGCPATGIARRAGPLASAAALDHAKKKRKKKR